MTHSKTKRDQNAQKDRMSSRPTATRPFRCIPQILGGSVDEFDVGCGNYRTGVEIRRHPTLFPASSRFHIQLLSIVTQSDGLRVLTVAACWLHVPRALATNPLCTVDSHECTLVFNTFQVCDVALCDLELLLFYASLRSEVDCSYKIRHKPFRIIASLHHARARLFHDHAGVREGEDLLLCDSDSHIPITQHPTV